MVKAYTIPNEKAIKIANKLIKEVLYRYRVLTTTIFNRGAQFISDVFKKVLEMLGIKQRMTTTYNPILANGQAKKAISILTNTLSKLVETNPKNWDLMSPYTW